MEKTNESKFSDAGLLVQITLIMALIMFGIIFLMTSLQEILYLMGYLLVCLLFIMAINNHITFKRKYFTAIYSVVGVLVLIISIFRLY